MLNVKNDDVIKQKFFTNTMFVLIFLLLCRIVASYFIPLNDSTEARYGEIARKMLETGNWVTLQHAYGVPFWAKPPLSSWLSALSMRVFGVNEFAARLPGLLLSIGILWLVWDLAKKHSGELTATLATLILASTLYFFLDAGTVMTDPSLIFCTTLALVAFWHAVVDNKTRWSYIFFIALGLGLLAKGPIAIVLVGIPVFFWVLIRNQWVNLWKKLPWIKGSLILFGIALPWYILAELRTPGFLNYFIVGEHINRFLTPGWTGDKYGLAHDEPKGMIWLYAVSGIFPWSIVGCSWLVQHGKKVRSLSRDDDGWMCYLVLCMVGPLVFFTFASNIIYPYVFPSLPAFALCFAELWNRSNPSYIKAKWIIPLSMMCGLFFIVATFMFAIKPDLIAKTQKYMVNAWIAQHPVPGSKLIYWDYTTPFSAEFYAAGKVVSTHNKSDLCTLLSNGGENYLVIGSHDADQLPHDLFAKFIAVDSVVFKNITFLLMHTPVLTC